MKFVLNCADIYCPYLQKNRSNSLHMLLALMLIIEAVIVILLVGCGIDKSGNPPSNAKQSTSSGVASELSRSWDSNKDGIVTVTEFPYSRQFFYRIFPSAKTGIGLNHFVFYFEEFKVALQLLV